MLGTKHETEFSKAIQNLVLKHKYLASPENLRQKGHT